MAEERLTPAEMTAARLNSLERRMELLEIWTGADEDGDFGTPALYEDVSALTEVVRYLMLYLELLVPGFSSQQLPEDLPALMADIRQQLAETDPEYTIPSQEVRDRESRVIARYFPPSIYRDGERPTGPFPKSLRALLRARLSTPAEDA